jgi:hypothetical protein
LLKNGFYEKLLSFGGMMGVLLAQIWVDKKILLVGYLQVSQL